MPLINFKSGEVDLSASDLRYVPMQDIVAEYRLSSSNLSEINRQLLRSAFYGIKHLFGCDLCTNQLERSPELIKEKTAMAEKAAGKKDQSNKNKKSKQSEKKKNQENGVKHMNEQQQQQHVHETNHVNHKKKDKSNRNNSNQSVKRNNSGGKGKKSGDSLLKRYFQLLFITTGYLFLAAGFLYLVDYDKYVKVREGGVAVLNKTLSLLPEEVVNKGKDILIPIAEGMVRRLNVIIKETSSFLNTNPVVKDHWTNIREIGSVCGGCLVEYLRTLYNHVTTYWCNAKAKLF